MLDSSEDPFILIYYNIRGKAQVIRSLLCFLQAKFVELHMELIEAATQMPSQEVIDRLKDKPIDKSQLPLLVDGKSLIYGTFAITFHLCKAAKRTDLFGANYHQQVQIFNILQKLLENQMKSQAMLLNLAEACSSKRDHQVRKLTHLTFQKVMNSSNYILQICQALERQGNCGFIFGNITIVDFYFMESCFYLLGIFGNIDKEYNCTFDSFYHSVVSVETKRKPNKLYLQQMRSFAARFAGKAFYRRHREYLESFSLIFSRMSQERREGLRRIWVGLPRCVQ